MNKMNKEKHSKRNLSCGFCGRSKKAVGNLIAGMDGSHICGRCLGEGSVMLAEHSNKNRFRGNKLPHPDEINKFLDRFVIGQQEPKKSLSVAVYNHYLRIQGQRINNKVTLGKSNILLIGKTGCGKTLLAQTLAKILDVPLVVTDATSLSETGYVGDDVESLLSKLIEKSDGDVDKAARGIIYLDEIDKIHRVGGSSSHNRDISGEGVQQSLLKIIEGSVLKVPVGNKRHSQKTVSIDTSNILFICGGAFEGLSEHISKRINKRTIGFNNHESEIEKNMNDNILSHVNNDDLVKFGMIPELLGRLPIVSVLHPLSVDNLKSVFSDTDDSLSKQFIEIFAMQNVKLVFSDDAVTEIAKRAFEMKNGARSLRALVEACLLNTMYEMPGKGNYDTVTVTADSFDTGKLIIKKKSSKKSAKKLTTNNITKNTVV